MTKQKYTILSMYASIIEKKNIKGIKQLQQVKTSEKLSNSFVKAFWQGVGILKQFA